MISFLVLRNLIVFFYLKGDGCDNNEIELYLDSGSRSSGELADTEMEHNTRRHSKNFTLSPETTDYDSNCGDLDSKNMGFFALSVMIFNLFLVIIVGLSNDVNGGGIQDFVRLYTSMPVLEDGLSSGHASDTENNNPIINVIDQQLSNNYPQAPSSQQQQRQSNKILTNKLIDNLDCSPQKSVPGMAKRNGDITVKELNSDLDQSRIMFDSKQEDAYQIISEYNHRE